MDNYDHATTMTLPHACHVRASLHLALSCIVFVITNLNNINGGKKLIVEIWNLNSKIQPLENQKNNGSIGSKFARQDFSKLYVVYISGVKFIQFWILKDLLG